MASSTQGTTLLRTGSLGRGFASLDPERQGEIPGRASSPQSEWSPLRTRSPRADWMRMTPERDASMFEGSSSRRSR